MKNVNILLFSFLLFTSCNSGNSANEEQIINEEDLEQEAVVEILEMPISQEKLPQEVQFEGNLKELIKWRDLEGTHIVVTAETGIFVNPSVGHEMDGSDAQLFAYHYLLDELTNKYIPRWYFTDEIFDCPLDIEANFIKKTLQISDLDKNDVSEIWLMSKKACHGDVSPCEMKITMYEGENKYTMKGQNKVKLSEKEFEGGKFTFDTNFKNGAEEFRTFAEKLWQENSMQEW